MNDVLACNRCGRRLRGSRRLRLCGPCSHQQQIEAIRALSPEERQGPAARRRPPAWMPRDADAE
jgi:hypothetical protein